MECHGDHLPGRYINTGVPSVEEGHDVVRISLVRSDVAEDVMSTMVKLAKMLDQVGQKAPRSVSGRCRWLRRGAPVAFPRQAVESDALLSPSASREGWLHGEVGAFNSHEQGACDESDCSGSRVKRVLTRSEDKVDKAEKDTVTLNEEKGDAHPQRKDMTPNATWVAFGVRSVVAWRKTVTLNEEKSEVHPGRKDMTPNAHGWRLACGASLLGERQ